MLVQADNELKVKCSELKQTLIAHVAVPTPLRRLFDYRVPAEFVNEVVVGGRVKVPFGKRQVVGLLIAVDNDTECPANKLKALIEVLDKIAIVPNDLLQLCQFASQYYQHALGDVISHCLPQALRQGKAATLVMPRAPLSSSEQATDNCEMVLTSEQTLAVDAIKNAFFHYQTFLLDGITGSGKTEVYLQAIAQVLAKDRQALVIVPEIALTPQTVARFEQRFGVTIAMLHSGLTPKQRLQAWLQAAAGIAQIVIGTRSAVFTPFARLGIIIIDEEHDASLKQQDGFRYSARDLAVMRAHELAIPIVLGSATPSLESYLHAKNNRYHYLRLQQRPAALHDAEIAIVDLRQQSLMAGLAQSVFVRVQACLNQGEQVLLFLNRRGYAPVIMCHQCGWLADCQRCDAHMTWHRGEQRLYCHHCGASQLLPQQCPQCQMPNLLPIGIGTEKIEEELQSYFPQANIVRIDRDSTRKKGELEKKLQAIHANEVQIIIGTQMLAKGHHFPNLGLAVIVDADSGLMSADFRAVERMGQLLIQVAGRTGRENVKGQVVLQTHQPEHPFLKTLFRQDYHQFLTMIAEQRRLAHLPPYSFLALLRAESTKKQSAFELLRAVSEEFNQRQPFAIEILGPIPSAMEKRQGKYRALLLLCANKRQTLQQFLQALVRWLEAKPSRQARWLIDVDPIEVL